MTEEPPAWWETPRRTALRAVAWLSLAGWAAGAIAVYLHTHVERLPNGFYADCRAPGWAQAVQLVVAAAGIGAGVYALNLEPPHPWRWGALVVALVGAWLAIALGVLPGVAQSCQS